MASPFHLKKNKFYWKQKNLHTRKNMIAEILSTYTHDDFNNKTIQ